MRGSEQFNTPVGEIKLLLHKGGEYNLQTNSIEGGKLLDSFEDKNLIVSKASILMARRLAPGVGPNDNTGENIADGLQYLAVGTGDSTWDLQSPPAPTLSQTSLVTELTRKEFTSWTFLDSAGTATTTPTNVIQLVTTYLENEAVGALVEMGLFGGDATSLAASGHMFNYKTFPVWNKPADARLTITWKITF